MDRVKPKYVYSRDFLLQFQHLYTRPPENFPDMAKILGISPIILEKSRRNEREKVMGEIKSLLNKITVTTFDRLSDKIITLLEKERECYFGECVHVLFEKVIREPFFADIYARLCEKISSCVPGFKNALLEHCRVTFESSLNIGEEKIHCVEGDDEEAYEEKQRLLGNIQFIGELYLRHMLPVTIIHHCIERILNVYEASVIKHHAHTDEMIEFLCKFMTVIGPKLERQSHPKVKEHIDRLRPLTNKTGTTLLKPRIRFMIMDLVDLYDNRWVPPVKRELPRKITRTYKGKSSFSAPFSSY